MSESAITAASIDWVEHFEDWPKEVRELAFELYYMHAGRNIRTLMRLLESGDYADSPYSIPDRTLRYWKRVDQWDIQADERRRMYAPNIDERTLGSTAVAALHGAEYLIQCTSGAVVPDFLRLKAAVHSLNAAGYGSYSKRAIMQQRDTASSSTSLRTMTDEELRKLERGEQ